MQSDPVGQKNGHIPMNCIRGMYEGCLFRIQTTEQKKTRSRHTEIYVYMYIELLFPDAL